MANVYMLKKPLAASRCRIDLIEENPEDDPTVRRRFELEELYEQIMLPIGTVFELVMFHDFDLALVRIYNRKIKGEDLFIAKLSNIEVI